MKLQSLIGITFSLIFIFTILNRYLNKDVNEIWERDTEENQKKIKGYNEIKIWKLLRTDRNLSNRDRIVLKLYLITLLICYALYILFVYLVFGTEW